MACAFIPEVIYIFKLLGKKASSAELPRITQRFNLIILGMGSLLIAVAILYDVNYLKYKQPINYTQWKEINWSDFRAIKRPQQTLNGSQNFASICSEISYSFSGDLLEISTLFHPARSYTYSEKQVGYGFLQHELYHLHITEYCSRLLRKEVSTFDGPLDKPEIVSRIEKFQKKERKLQHQYDDESFHGYVLSEQKAWQYKMDSSLNRLKNFANPIIKLNQ